MRHRYMTPHDAPALLGLPEGAPGRFTLYHRLRGTYPDPAGHRRAATVPALRAQLAAHLAAHPVLGLDASLPRPPRRHPEIGLEGAPDLIIAPDSRYGNGPGIAIVEPIEPAQWRTRWRHTEGYPWPTPEARARIEALFLLYPTDWGIIIPQVGWGPPRPALRVTPDDTLKARLHQEIGAIDHALVRGRPPAPDARADRACLAHLASLSAPARIEPRTTDDAQGDVIRREINTTEERRRELDAARLRFDEARASYDNAVLALTQAAGGAGTVLLDDVILRITAEPVAFVPAHRHRTRIDVERSGEQATYHTH